MSVRNGVLGALSFIGVCGMIGLTASLVYVDRQLHKPNPGYKYGPARHLEFLSNVAHRANREMESEAVETMRRCAMEDRMHYDSMADEREDREERLRNARMASIPFKNGTV